MSRTAIIALGLVIASSPGAARVSAQEHEQHAHLPEQLVQRGVPREPRDEVVQVSRDDARADALEPVHAAEETDGGQRRIGVAERDRMHRQAAARRL